MENLKGRRAFWVALTVLGPVGFGSTYWFTQNFLPASSPLWGSALRAVPAGMVLMLIVRRLPAGGQWWRAGALGTINMGLFFLLAFTAARLLPSSIAASIGAASPMVIALFAYMVLGERTRLRMLLTALAGASGVLLIVGSSTQGLNAVGLVSSVGMMVLMALGAALNKRWDDGTPVLTMTAWQLMISGVGLVVVAVLLEGAPPRLDGPAVVGVAYVSLFATALGYFCWFSGFKHLPATTVGIIGLLNPVSGVALGVWVGGETFTMLQFAGVLIVVASVALAQFIGRSESTLSDGCRRVASSAVVQSRVGCATGTR